MPNARAPALLPLLVSGLILAWPAGSAPTPTPTPTTEVAALRERVTSALALHASRPLDVARHTPWELLHRMLAFGPAAPVVGPSGSGDTAASALEWLSRDRPMRGQHLFAVQRGELTALSGPGAQAHAGQALAVLALTGVPLDHETEVAGHRFRVADLLAAEQQAVAIPGDHSFQLIGLAHYLGADATWRGADGEPWSLERVLALELERGVSSGACGGSHRLMALTAAVQAKRAAGEELNGPFARARWMLDEYRREAFRGQNPDGSFSTRWFEGPEARPDLARRLETSGHVLEWLTASLDADELDAPRVSAAVGYLADLLLAHPERRWSPGPLGHALHALSLWSQNDANAARKESP